ncbi:MT-A70 family methyltransferase [Bradyrhizobium sp.]|uniref:MT-A70 family methyltransferase n=1 Tax=Bradyrhizobium sp. TaxID=376 RepID=UPI003C4D8D86
MSWQFDSLTPLKYGAILADPPWRMKMYSAKGMGRSPDGLRATTDKGYYRNGQRQNNPERHYQTMSLDEIRALPVGQLAAPDCVLFMWAIDPLLPEAIEVGRAWGFAFKTVAFYWAKERRVTSDRHKLHDDANHKRFPISTGYWTRANPEQCLLFTMGRPKRLSAAVRKLVISPRREHSRKPDECARAVEQLVAGPYCELFARTSRPGWDCWGNQTDRFQEAS